MRRKSLCALRFSMGEVGRMHKEGIPQATPRASTLTVVKPEGARCHRNIIPYPSRDFRSASCAVYRTHMVSPLSYHSIRPCYHFSSADSPSSSTYFLSTFCVSSHPSFRVSAPSAFDSFRSSCLLRLRRHFGVSGSYGYSIFGGNRETSGNTKLVELPRESSDSVSESSDLHTSKLHVMKWPSNVRKLGGRYFFRKTDEHPVTYYHMNLGNDDSNSFCFVASTDPAKVHAPKIENALFESTRGFATQIILSGRGVKAYFQPDWPNLYIRLGVGVKPIDATRVALKYPGDVKVFLEKKGTQITVHGWDKRKVGNVAGHLFGVVKANPYTMKGGHIAHHPIRQKVVRKK